MKKCVLVESLHFTAKIPLSLDFGEIGYLGLKLLENDGKMGLNRQKVYYGRLFPFYRQNFVLS